MVVINLARKLFYSLKTKIKLFASVMIYYVDEVEQVSEVVDRLQMGNNNA